VRKGKVDEIVHAYGQVVVRRPGRATSLD
jgi:hypothetical protein